VDDLVVRAGIDERLSNRFPSRLPLGYIRMAMSNARWMRNRNCMLDGRGHFYKVTDAGTREDYENVTNSQEREAIEARERLQRHLDRHMPLPDYSDPLTEHSWERYFRYKQPVEVYHPKPSN
jgi:hypothetical protein